MDDLGDLVTRTHDYLFRFSSWSRIRRAGFITTVIYATSLYGFIAINRIKDHQLNEDLKQKGVVVSAIPDNSGDGVSKVRVLQNSRKIGSATIGNSRGHIVNTLAYKLADSLGIHDKVGRILIENDPKKLSDYRTEGYKKFAASYFIISSAYPLAFVHPIGIIIAPAGLYLNWDGEAGLYSDIKIQSIVRARTNNSESELGHKKMVGFFKEREPNYAYANFGLLLYAASTLGSLLYVMQKIKNLAPK